MRWDVRHDGCMLGLVSGLRLVLVIVTSLCDMCTKYHRRTFWCNDINANSWRMDSELESGVGRRHYVILYITSAKCQ